MIAGNDDISPTEKTPHLLEREEVTKRLGALTGEGYSLVGPTVQGDAIVGDDIDDMDQRGLASCLGGVEILDEARVIPATGVESMQLQEEGN